jgi:hypothetical protein
MRLQSDARPRHCWHASRGPDRKLPGTRRRLEADSLMSEIPRGQPTEARASKAAYARPAALPRRRQGRPRSRGRRPGAANQPTAASSRARRDVGRHRHRRPPPAAPPPRAGRPPRITPTPPVHRSRIWGTLGQQSHSPSGAPKGRRGLRRHVPGRLTQSRSPTARALDDESDVGDAGASSAD